MKFTGINYIVITPFTEDEKVDYESLSNLIDKKNIYFKFFCIL